MSGLIPTGEIVYQLFQNLRVTLLREKHCCSKAAGNMSKQWKLIPLLLRPMQTMELYFSFQILLFKLQKSFSLRRASSRNSWMLHRKMRQNVSQSFSPWKEGHCLFRGNMDMMTKNMDAWKIHK